MAASIKNTSGEPVHAKPFLKWAGSKRQLLNQFINLYPPQLKAGTIKNYYEPFLGSGAVFFDVSKRYKVENVFLSDVNADLILTYKIVQSHVSSLTEVLLKHQKKYLALNKTERLKYFYDQRALFNIQPNDFDTEKKSGKAITRAARLIFLNRTCFNGLFRVNSKGAFNTPAGQYAKPAICDEVNLKAVSGLLQKANIKKSNYNDELKDIKPASFVYFDPPYRPLSRTSNFTAYSKSAFTDEQQARLAQLFRDLNEKGAAVMLSNSETNDCFFDHLYKDFHIVRVPAKRLINSDASKRGLVNEIVVTNYPV
jgi:DNA adenine methylase